MKIYDCFIFFNEIELLDLRLRTLNDLVNYFVIAELNITHSGKPKPYYFDDFKSIFQQYENKIIHLKETFVPNEDPWVVENAHRNLLAKGYSEANPEDYIIISDLDEIPRPGAIKEGIEKQLDAFVLHETIYCWYVNCKSSQQWPGSVVIKKRLIKTPNDVRNNRWAGYPHIKNGGWHYTSMGGKERVRIKFDAFAEQSFNNLAFIDDENLDICLETGRDLTNRGNDWAKKYFISLDEIDHPEVIEWAKQYSSFIK